MAIRIVTDQTENELAHQIKSSGATEIAVSPNGKEVAFILHGDVFVTSTEYKNDQTDYRHSPNRNEASTLLPTEEALYMPPKEMDSGRFTSPP